MRPRVFWLYGLSGAGKSSLATAAGAALKARGQHVIILDGDRLRSGLCRNLGFSLADRMENVRRTAEMARLLCDQGFTVLVALMTPHENMRQLAREIVGKEHFHEIYVKCDFTTCSGRDPKGLYARANLGNITDFVGLDLLFEEPQAPDLVIDTKNSGLESCVSLFLDTIRPQEPAPQG